MATYLITGANKGIGLELVTQLAALPTSQVSTVFALARRTSSSLDKLPNDRVTPVIIPNLASADDISEAVAQVTEKLSGRGLDVLVNNAGQMVATQNGTKVADMGVKELLETVEANVGTALAVTSGFLPLLRQGKDKKIFNISTTLGSLTQYKKYSWSPFHAYKISKSALNMLNQQLALDLGPEGFTVALITPGWLKTQHPQADLEVPVGVKAVIDIVHSAGPEQNGKFLNIKVEGWEEAEGPNQYDGKEVPW